MVSVTHFSLTRTKLMFVPSAVMPAESISTRLATKKATNPVKNNRPEEPNTVRGLPKLCNVAILHHYDNKLRHRTHRND